MIQRKSDSTVTNPQTRRVRRTHEQLIADLEQKIAALKTQAERRRTKADPTIRYVALALKSIDKALASTQDSVTRTTLGEARSILSAFLTLHGVIEARGSRGRRSTGRLQDLDLLYEYVAKHPGQRGSQIAEAMGTDANTIRPAMKKLIIEGKVKTKGEKRAMTYAEA